MISFCCVGHSRNSDFTEQIKTVNTRHQIRRIKTLHQNRYRQVQSNRGLFIHLKPNQNIIRIIIADVTTAIIYSH